MYYKVIYRGNNHWDLELFTVGWCQHKPWSADDDPHSNQSLFVVFSAQVLNVNSDVVTVGDIQFAVCKAVHQYIWCEGPQADEPTSLHT